MAGDSPKRRLRSGAVAKATNAELADLGMSPATNAQAAAAVRLAKELDSSDVARDSAAAARELRQAMAVVRGLAPPKEKGDRVDELAARAAARAQRATA